jgi:hypothetical protein
MKSELIQVTENGQFTSKYGEMAKYLMKFANGTEGEYNSKTFGKTNIKYKEGQEYEFEFTPNPNPSYHGKIKFTEERSNGKGGGNLASFALSYAKDLKAAEIARPDWDPNISRINTMETANVFLKWLRENQ